MSFLVSRRSNWTADDYLAEALRALTEAGGEPLTYSATRGQLCSIRVRFLAADEQTARAAGQAAMAVTAQMAQFVDAFRLAPSKSTARERGEV